MMCMRVLGEERDGGRDNACARGRKWIHDRGGATFISFWGKTWLSVQCMHPIQCMHSCVRDQIIYVSSM